MGHITIIGLGLIGGSMGLALKRSGVLSELVGYARHSDTRSKACQVGAVDRVETNLPMAVRGAELVIIATPVMSIRGILEQIADHLSPGCVVTDTASTKAQVMKWAEEYIPAEVSFIGGHPMAGKEEAGVEAADARLFCNCTYCLVKGSSTTLEVTRQVVELVMQIGGNPLIINAQEHDNLVAGISHLPALLSSALVLTTIKSPDWPQMSKLAARGYRDLTRLASGDVEMNRDICLSNGQSIARWIDNFIAELSELRYLLDEDGERLERALSRAREARQKWLLEDKNNGRDKEA